MSDVRLDVIVNGKIVKNVPRCEVMVEAQTDLANLTDYPWGTIAFIAGRGSQWQLASDGQWVSMS